MPKNEKMITRTITATKINCFCMNIVDRTCKEIEIVVPSFDSVKEKDKREFVEKQLRGLKAYEKHAMAFYTVTGAIEKRYGMSETLFMQYAHELTKDENENAENA